MNLEDIEQRTLTYLKQVSNPLVRLDVLYAHLFDELTPHGKSLTMGELQDFLAKHELFRLMEPLGLDGDPGMAAALSAVGLVSGPCVILDTRLPTRDQLAAMMLEQLNQMAEALATALHQAREENDEARAKAILRTLDRTGAIRKKVLALGQASAPERN